MYFNQLLDFLKNSKRENYNLHVSLLFNAAFGVCNLYTTDSVALIRARLCDALDTIIANGDLLVLAEHIRPHSGISGNWDISYNSNIGGSPFVSNLRQLAGGSIHCTNVSEDCTYSKKPVTIFDVVSQLKTYMVNSALHQLKYRNRDTVCFHYCGHSAVIDARSRFLVKQVGYPANDGGSSNALADLAKRFQTEHVEDIIRLDDAFLTSYAAALVKNAPDAA